MAVSNDIKYGKEGLTYFHNQALKYPENYTLTFQELLEKLSDMSHGQFLDGFGFAISSANVSDKKVQESMTKLADDGKGKIPQKWSSFFSYLSDSATKISFIEGAEFIATESAKDIVDGTSKIGKTVIEAGKNALDILGVSPFILAAFGIMYLYTKAKRA